jgi:hypothetical protein
MMDIDRGDVRWNRLRADCRVFAPRTRQELVEAACDCGFSIHEAAEIANAFGGASLPRADSPKSRVQPEGDQLLAVLRMLQAALDPK